MTFPLTLIRGLPGSGKTTYAKDLCDRQITDPPTLMVAADDYFVNECGKYVFRPGGLGAAHNWCREQARNGIEDRLVIVHNTFSTLKELQPYYDMTRNCYTIDLYDGKGLSDEELAARGTHGVPAKTIQRMRARWFVPRDTGMGQISHICKEHVS